ncbi:hypothetical protein Zmor_014450 [Zophobas morio]|uniref:Uncharacterized protein n=1 Tax=Zophobas morio TaxID=2755281 RepID=A0AA38IFZ3_9CUCU|nr:hypothetical protein Zmor_014450 [Zophobas morio]
MMSRKDRLHYKGVVKTNGTGMVNSYKKLYKEFGITFDLFKDMALKDARSARDGKRRQLEIIGDKRKRIASILFEEKQNKHYGMRDYEDYFLQRIDPMKSFTFLHDDQ